MKNFLKKEKDWLVLFVAVIVILVMFIGVNAAGVYSNLKEYGYGIKELPETLAVYFHLSEGFTVEEQEDGMSVFIGNEDLQYYSDIISKYGYKEERSGNDAFYKKEDSQGNNEQFVIGATEDWCHWFRVYTIDNDYKIEDFK